MLHPSGPDVTWRQLVIHLLGMSDSSIFYENLKQKLIERIGDVDCVESLGLLDDKPVVKLNTPLDTLSHYLSKRLAFGEFINFSELYFNNYLSFLLFS